MNKITQKDLEELKSYIDAEIVKTRIDSVTIKEVLLIIFIAMFIMVLMNRIFNR